MAPQLINFAAALIAGPDKEPAPGARIIVAGVVEVAPGHPLSDGRALARSYRAMLGFLPPSAALRPLAGNAPADPNSPTIPVHRVVKVAHSVATGIKEAAVEEGADLLLLHWKGSASSRSAAFGEITDELLNDPPCNTLLFRPGHWQRLERILLAARGGPSAELALEAAVALAASSDADVTLLHAVPAARALERQHATTVGAATNGSGNQAARQRGDEPYIDLAAQAAALADRHHVTIKPSLTASPDVPGVVASAAVRHDLVVLGVPQPADGAGVELNDVVRGVAAERNKPLLLARAARALDLPDYRRRVSHNGATAVVAAEQWFVENTYHGDEMPNVENWLSIKASRGAYLSVVILTHNDAPRIYPLLTGLRKALQEHAPVADEILVVDAASTDDTAALVAKEGFPVLQVGRHMRERGAMPDQLQLLSEATNLARGSIIVWLEPKAGRINPGMVPALTLPLLSDPGVRLVKPFWSAHGTAEIGEGEFTNSGASYSHLRANDLLTMKTDELTRLPLHALFRAFFPALGALVDPEGRVFAARATLLKELIPALKEQQQRFSEAVGGAQRTSASLSFQAGLLLETAQRHGARAIAQVEMPRRRGSRKPAAVTTIDLRHLRQIAELLELFSLHLDKITDPDTLVKLRRSVNKAIT